MNVITRIPPSPTGHLHIGTARTALFNYLFAKHKGGSFIFRSEDTDPARSKKEFEDEIIEGLTWLGLSWDSFSRQSENAARHRTLLEKLIGEGKAYLSKEPTKDDPGKLREVVRLKNPGASVTFTDAVRGEVTFDTSELRDFILARSLDEPLYHFAVVADDFDSGVTHVIRGEDHISNTPRQILIQEALGFPRPIYAHIPLILDAKRAKLSKRSPLGVPTVLDYQAEGILPEGLVNYLALLGWNPGNDREDFSLSDLVAEFSLKGVQKAGAVFDRTKLLSVNQRWMRKLSDDDFLKRGTLDAPDRKRLEKAAPVLKERTKTFREARALLEGELHSIFEEPTLDKNKLVVKEPAEATREYLKGVEKIIGELPQDPSAEAVKILLMPYADEKGRAAVLWPLRYALSGQEQSPDPFTLISILGKDESLSRIKKASELL